MIGEQNAGKFIEACCGNIVVDLDNLKEALTLQYLSTGIIPDVKPFIFCPWCGTKIVWIEARASRKAA